VIQANIPLDVGNWRSYSWSGPLFWYSDRDDASTGYGLSDANYPLVHRPRWGTLQFSFH
jgi:hypothetical protein